MSARRSEVCGAFRAIDAPEDKAPRAAAALASVFSERDAETEPYFDERDGKIGRIEADIASIRADLAGLRDGAATKADLDLVKIDITAVKGDVALLKWMTGFLLAFDAAIVFELFSH